MGIGIIISGIFILKKNPNARAVAAWIAFTALAYAIGKPKFTLYHYTLLQIQLMIGLFSGMCILMFFGCPTTSIMGLRYDEL